MLTEWMRANIVYDDARELTYASFPMKWVWNRKLNTWTRRKQGNSIGRIAYVHPTAGELYYLRMLLNVVKGPKNFDDLKMVDNILHPTFQSACRALGLLGDDKEWHEVLNETSNWANAFKLRQLFVTLILFCEVTDPKALWELHWKDMQDDIVHRLQQNFGLHHLHISEAEIQNYILFELELLFNVHCTSLNDHYLPMPDARFAQDLNNRLLREELNYDVNTLQCEHTKLVAQLNSEQKIIYDVVIDVVTEEKGQLFFVYGHGGTGKTFLYETIVAKIRSQGKIVLAVASSGIASLLLPGGRTAHSRFKIPIDINEYSTCHIKKGTQLAKLIEKTSLIVWDEAPMTHRNCFEAIDKTFNDLLASNSGNKKKPFGGKVVLLGGDFRQVLPIIAKGSKTDTLNASLTESYLWDYCKVYSLTTNMRLVTVDSSCENVSRAEFAEWILNVGDGKIAMVKMNEEEEEPAWIKVPNYLLTHCESETESDQIAHLASLIYEDFHDQYNNSSFLKERAILTARNDVVDIVNAYVLSLVPSEEKVYFSFDSLIKDSCNTDDEDLQYSVEYLNSVKFNGVPDHQLSLKCNAPVMFLRNLNQNGGLCNGTRLLITQLGAKVIEAKILTGSHIGEKVYIPHIVMTGTDNKLPFRIKRRQFPIRLCYSMTINKSQGQTLKKVGLYLLTPVFSHEQLYVVVSRVTSPQGLKILLKNDEGVLPDYTKNIVYSEIFDTLK